MAANAEILPARYADARLIGSGGMGAIYLARDTELGRPVAVKVLHERFAEDADLRARFRREALTAARLSGQHGIVTIFDVGEHGGRPFIVMEHLTGGSLAERADGRTVAPDVAVDWLRQAGAALDAAHEAGVVHRDVKPANLILDGEGRLHVVDFGIARLADGTLGLTAPGTVLGTAGYLSPEQAQGREATPASDRYALGVVAYELLTGARPFERRSETAEAAAHVHEPVPPASERAPLPVAVDAVLARALAKDPARRFPTAAAFVDALEQALGAHDPVPAHPPPPPAARQPRRTAAGAVVAGALLLASGGVAAALIARDDGGDGAAAPGRETVTQEVTVEGEATTVVRTVTDAPEEEPAPEPEGVSPEEAAALNDDAFRLMQQGRWEDALPLLEEAVPALRGTFSDGFRYEAWAEYNLGRTLVELDRCDEALPHLERSRELQGNRREIKEAVRACGPPGQSRGRGKGEDEGDD
ncbi:MAG TPA: serine/threonine-protein kinase [Gaiellaceae bacterium]|nr:serine/threonine-protein kinase [Gaiellaceae bacterium]